METAKRIDLCWRPLESSLLTPIELNYVWWASGADAVFFLDWDRDRRSVRLVLADPSTGECTVVVSKPTGTSTCWCYPIGFLTLPDGFAESRQNSNNSIASPSGSS